MPQSSTLSRLAGGWQSEREGSNSYHGATENTKKGVRMPNRQTGLPKAAASSVAQQENQASRETPKID